MMVTFAPGELSSVEKVNNDDTFWTTKSYNLKDLPCPPYDVRVSTILILTS